MSPTFWKAATPSGKVRRALKTQARTSRLTDHKAEVRGRDKGCRVPQCGCRRFRLRLEVAHHAHQGAGGNPAEDRNDPRNLMLVCAERHKDNPIAIDKHSLKWEPIDPAKGANGPVRWYIDIALYDYLMGQAPQRPTVTHWIELASEVTVGQRGPMSPRQEAIARQLALMEM